MRTLSISTFFCFLLLFAAHWSWWKTSSDIKSKLSLNSSPIFEGPSKNRILKLDRLQDIVMTKKTRNLAQEQPKEESLNKEQFFELAMDSDTDFHELEKRKNQIAELKHYQLFELLAFFLRENRLPNNGKEAFDIRWSTFIIEDLIALKKIDPGDPSLLALKKAFKSKGPLTKEYFRIYENLAYDIELYKSFDGQIDERKLYESLSRLDLDLEQISEFKDGHDQEMGGRY